MIDIFTYNTQDKTYQSDLAVEDIGTCPVNENVYLWVDFNNPPPTEIDVLKTIFKLDSLTIEDCTHSRQLPKLEFFQITLFYCARRYP